MSKANLSLVWIYICNLSLSLVWLWQKEISGYFTTNPAVCIKFQLQAITSKIELQHPLIFGPPWFSESHSKGQMIEVFLRGVVGLIILQREDVWAPTYLLSHTHSKMRGRGGSQCYESQLRHRTAHLRTQFTNPGLCMCMLNLKMYSSERKIQLFCVFVTS